MRMLDVDEWTPLDERESPMRFEKALVFSVVFAMLYAVGSGCQKAHEKPQAGMEIQATQLETADQPSAEGAVSTMESQSSVASERQPTGDQPVAGESANAGDAGPQTQESTEADDDEGISLGRMVGGMFRAARSLAPLPAPASSDRRTESTDQAPAFPQQ